MTATADAPFIQLPLIRMVDLAINSPDGLVNFHLLQAILHALIQKTEATNLSVELHGNEAIMLTDQLKIFPEKPTFTIKETTDKSSQGKEQQVYVLTHDTAYQGHSSIAKEKVDYLEAELSDVQKQITELRDLPGNLGIIDAVKNADEKATNVLDVFHMMSLQKRVEAAEEGMVKVATIVEDLIKSPGALTLETKNVICQKDEDMMGSEDARKDHSTSRSSLHKSRSKSSKVTASEGDFISRVSQMAVEDQVKELVKEVGHLRSSCGDMETSTLSQLVKDVEELQVRLKLKRPKSSETISAGEEGEDVTGLPTDLEIGLMEEKFKEVTDHLDRLDSQFTEEVTKLHSQFTDIERDFNELLNKIEMGLSGGDSNEPNACCAAVYQKLIQLQTDFTDMTETSSKLLQDKDEKAKLMDVILEQIEVLKTVKADREDIEEALADKADACAVLRKVSHDQFDNACEELSKGIEEALEKLTQQELLWQQALDDIQSEIGNKLDKMDLGPLREFINNKLRMLQDKMKSLAALKREQEAAGSKNKLLRDVNCISCDKEVVMRKEFDLSFRPPAPMIPPTRSMAPYLAYELDALRKQQKAIPGSKNLHNFEAAMQGRLQKKTDDHICNRYCGGSHTITTPQQRVTRLGHFLMQWGPEAQPTPGSDPKKGSSATQQATSVALQPEVGTAPHKAVSKDTPGRRPSKQSASKVGSKITIEDDRRGSVEAKHKRTSQTSDAKRSQASLKSATKSKEPTSKTSHPREIHEEAHHEDGKGAAAASDDLAGGDHTESAPTKDVSAELVSADDEEGQLDVAPTHDGAEGLEEADEHE